jgi:2-oxoglutarate dehydrogenase E2 component (dihydrolipoamide succinyltransferase)
MGQVNIEVPAMGEGITEASITKFLKNVGDKVEIDEPIVEIATDKVDSEIVATHNGTIEKFLFEEGDVAQVGDVIVVLQVEGKGDTESAGNKVVEVEKPIETITPKVNETGETTVKERDNILFQSKTPGGKILSPLVRNIAKKENLSIAELDNINGTGVGKRITKDDVLSYMKQGTAVALSPQKETKTIDKGSNFELVEMDRMRKLIADHMIESKKTSAHVTSFVEVDVTPIVNWRNKVKDEFQHKYGEKITFTPIFIEAIVQAIKEFPMINVSVDGSTIVVKKDINIGMATALPSGNLIVPVIKNSSTLSLLGITQAVNDLAKRARINKLKPDEIQGGTFTVTNMGTFGNITGTPIINQPEVAIVALGAIKKKPAVIETPQGDTIGIRHIMILSMSYDHRVVDGALGGMFIKRVADLLEAFDEKRNI